MQHQNRGCHRTDTARYRRNGIYHRLYRIEYRIARNAARDRLRSLRPELPAQEGLPDETPLPEELAELRERDETVRRAVEAMSPPDRELFIRFYYLEQTVGEISAVTGQNPSKVKSRLRRGREKLRGYLTERGICHA